MIVTEMNILGVKNTWNYVNAFWDGQRLTFGDGDGASSNYLGVLDIAAHELGHAVTDYEANLTYSYESGALNEGASDIFAAVVEAHVDGGVTTNNPSYNILTHARLQ